jgi:hypothetical protein
MTEPQSGGSDGSEKSFSIQHSAFSIHAIGTLGGVGYHRGEWKGIPNSMKINLLGMTDWHLKLFLGLCVKAVLRFDCLVRYEKRLFFS